MGSGFPFCERLPDKQTGVVRAHIQPTAVQNTKSWKMLLGIGLSQTKRFSRWRPGGLAAIWHIGATFGAQPQAIGCCARKNNWRAANDVNLRPPFDNAELIRHLAGQADLIKLNDEELEVVAHGLYPTLSLDKAAGEYAPRSLSAPLRHSRCAAAQACLTVTSGIGLTAGRWS
jgi:hypothetical protein